MTSDFLKEKLKGGAMLVFAKILNATHNVRGCCAIELDKRNGFRMIEQNLKQVRKAISAEGILILQLKDDKILPVSSFGENIVTELPEEMEEEIFQLLPRNDFTAKVQAQRLLRKLGFDR